MTTEARMDLLKWINNNIISEMDKLEGFEKVLGRKFTNDDFAISTHKETHLRLCLCILDKIKLKDKEIEETKIDTHPTFLLPNPFFHNNHICPFCNEEVKKKDEKGRCRLQIGKQYQWYHKKCKDSSGINPMRFENIKLKLML